MKIKSKSKIGSGRPRAERNGMTSKGKALLVFTVIAGLASIVYATTTGPCCLTIQGPCADGGSYTNQCTGCTNTFVYTIVAGPNINVCPCTYTNGYFDCTNDPVITNGCIQSYSYTACPGVPANAGSVTNNSYPDHAIQPGCPARKT